jgi:hypothetical protein
MGGRSAHVGPSRSLAAVVVRDGVSGRSGQNRIGRKIDAVDQAMVGTIGLVAAAPDSRGEHRVHREMCLSRRCPWHGQDGTRPTSARMVSTI